MKTFPIASLIILLSFGIVKAQNIVWMHDAGSASSESGKAVCTDNSGNVYVTGELVTNSGFDAVSVNAYFDGFIAKYNSSGIIQWVKTFGGSGASDIIVTRIKCDSQGFVYVCGQFRFQPLFQSVTFDTITVNGNNPNEEFAFVAKYNSSGDIQWLRYGGGTNCHAVNYDLDFDTDDNVYLCGSFEDTATFNAQSVIASSTVPYAGFLLKYDSNGNLLHTSQISSTTRSRFTGIEIAPVSKRIYAGGTFRTSLNINSVVATPVSGGEDAFVAAFDSTFTCLWITNGGGDNLQYPGSVGGIEIDPSENIYLAGAAAGNMVQFGNYSFTSAVNFDYQVVTTKFDSSGTVQWLKHGGGANSDNAMDIITNSQGNSVITGSLMGNVPYVIFDTDTIQILTQSLHCYLTRYDANGNLLYARRMGLGNDEFGAGLAFYGDTTFYLTGATQGLTQFDTLNFFPSYVNPNIFIAKFYDNNFSVNVMETRLAASNVNVYPNPAFNSIIISFLTGRDGAVCIALLDMQGRKVKEAFDGRLIQGRHEIKINVSDLPGGIYICEVKTITSTLKKKIIIR
jgi:hypothetical protein